MASDPMAYSGCHLARFQERYILLEMLKESSLPADAYSGCPDTDVYAGIAVSVPQVALAGDRVSFFVLGWVMLRFT